jgi:hypothetical protein
VKWVAAAAGGVAAVVAAVVLLAGGDEAPPVRAADATAIAAVERRDLVDRESVDGTLGYAGAAALLAGDSGVVTALPEPGSVLRRGDALYRLGDEPAAWLLYGALPAWRDFSSGMTDGEDVRQLERNLRALGHDPDGDLTVDDDWDWATTAAVLRFQDERGLTEDGALTRGEIVFRDGAARVGVEEVGKVAEQAADEEGEPTIEVTIALRGRVARGRGFDQAPVDVGFEADRRRDVLVVPITALLARAGGGFAVETEDGALIDVEPGAYAEDYVEVSGDGLREGLRVVTAG